MLVLLTVEVACTLLHFIKGAARKDAVAMFLVVFEDIELYGSVALVGLSCLEDLLHQVDLLDDVT